MEKQNEQIVKYYYTENGFKKLEDEIKNRRTIRKSLDELLFLHRNALVIEETEEYKNWDGTTVSRKCAVELEIDGEIEKYTILGHGEASVAQNILSCEAPVVLKLLGKKIDESIEFNNMKIVVKGISKIKENEKVMILTPNNNQ